MAELLDAKKMTETSKSARRHAGKRRLDFSLLVPGHLPGGGTPALYHLPHCGTPTADQPQTANHARWLKGLKGLLTRNFLPERMCARPQNSENSKANRIETMKGPAQSGQICSVGRRKIAKKIAKNKRCYAVLSWLAKKWGQRCQKLARQYGKYFEQHLTKEQQRACLETAAAELIREITQQRPLN